MDSYYPPKMIPRVTLSTADAQLHCRKCRTSLAGLKSDDHCPTCGAAVAASMHSSEIRYSDPGYVLTLRRGAAILLWGTLITLVAMALTKVDEAGDSNGDRLLDPRIPIGFIWGGMLIYSIGTWLLTTPDPSGLGERSYGLSRKICRAMLLLATLAAVAVAGFARIPFVNHWPFLLAIQVAVLPGAIGWLAMLQYLSKLASRMRETPLSERARILRGGWLATCTLLILTEACRDFLLPTQFAIDNDLGGLVVAFEAIAGLTGLVLLVLWIIMLLRLGDRLKEQAKLARIAWQVG